MQPPIRSGDHQHGRQQSGRHAAEGRCDLLQRQSRRARISRDQEQGPHDQCMPHQVDATEGIDGCREDDDQGDRGEATDQCSPEQAEAHGEFRHARHGDEGIAGHAERQEGALFDQRVEPFGVSEFFQARPHQSDGDTPAQDREAVLVPFAVRIGRKREVPRNADAQGEVVEQMEEVVVAQRDDPEPDNAGCSQRHGSPREDEKGDQQLQPGNPFVGRLQVRGQINAAHCEDGDEEGANDGPHEIVRPRP